MRYAIIFWDYYWKYIVPVSRDTYAKAKAIYMKFLLEPKQELPLNEAIKMRL
jgi:hypothetical protein